MKHIARHLHQLKPTPVDYFMERVVDISQRDYRAHHWCNGGADSDYDEGFEEGFNTIKNLLEEIVKLYEVDCEIHQHNYKKALEHYIENDYNVFTDESVPF